MIILFFIIISSMIGFIWLLVEVFGSMKEVKKDEKVYDIQREINENIPNNINNP